MPRFQTGLVWFRRDLRATDNAALHHALDQCAQVHAVFVLGFMLALAPLVSFVPMAVFAGLLSVVAWNMAGKAQFWMLLRTSRSDAVIVIVTFLLVVFRDLTDLSYPAIARQPLANRNGILHLLGFLRQSRNDQERSSGQASNGKKQ